MLVYSCHTPSHQLLYDRYYAPTLPASLTDVPRVLEIEGAGDFMTRSFRDCICEKLALQVESVIENESNVIIWSDVDIVFARDPVPYLDALFAADRTLDLAFQTERAASTDTEVNVGFVAMRCSSRVASFFRQVLAAMDEHPEWNDQAAINHVLPHQSEVRWTKLPVTFAARSQGWPPPSDLVLYHANCTAGTKGVAQKERQFADLEVVQRYGAVGAAWTLSRQFPSRLASFVIRLGRSVRRRMENDTGLI